MSPPPDADEDQPALLPGLVRARARASRDRASRSRTSAAQAVLAEVDPVARVLVDVPLAHLDRPFDYAVPASMAGTARPGARVKVRFAGSEVDGFVLERCAESEHPGALTPLRRVVSDEPVLSPAVAGLVAAVADRYAGARSDVLRLAVPPRHATTERAPSVAAPAWTGDVDAAVAAWSDHVHGASYAARLAAGEAPRAVWSAPPGADWPALLAQAVAATYASGRGALVCLPDVRDVARLDAALTEILGEAHHVVLTAGSGPSARYRDFLAVSRAARRIVIGTRSAAFAPVRDLGLVAIWDDGDDLHAEPRAPYPHTREVLLLRAEREGTAALIGGFGRSVEAQYLLRTGWAQELVALRDDVRRRVRVEVTGASEMDLIRDVHTRQARLPKQAHDAIRTGLEQGPVLVQVPRPGYAVALACERCRHPARCAQCRGPLQQAAAAVPPACRWCGTTEPAWACGECGHRGLRAPVVGGLRTAEELGRSFPGARVQTSSGDRIAQGVRGPGALVVATPGAEPVAEGGYAAVVLLDTWLALTRVDLRTEEEALRRWLGAAGLIRPGGVVLVVGDAGLPVVQALVRWDPAGFAVREIAERAAAHLPPASRLATVTGEVGAVDDALTLLALPEPAEVLGPVAVDEGMVRAVIRVPRAGGTTLTAALAELQRVRSARKLDPVRIQVDPISL